MWCGQKKYASGSRLSGLEDYRTHEWLGMVGVILLYACLLVLAAGFGG